MRDKLKEYPVAHTSAKVSSPESFHECFMNVPVTSLGQQGHTIMSLGFCQTEVLEGFFSGFLIMKHVNTY